MKLEYEKPGLVKLNSKYLASGSGNSCIIGDMEPTPEDCEIISLPDQT